MNLSSLFASIVLLVAFNSGAQMNAHLPMKSFTFDYVSVQAKNSEDSTYREAGVFTGVGEIHIYDDSINVNWSNEWECGKYRLLIDTSTYEQFEIDEKLEYVSFYSVRSKGYHAVDGLFTLVEGSDTKIGDYVHVYFDTEYTAEGWAKKRRVYIGIQRMESENYGAR